MGAAEVVRVAVLFVPALEAVIVVEAVVVAGKVGIAKVVLVAPVGTVTLAGTVARVTAELVRVTTVPPAGAAALSVTVPVTAIPPTALVGFTETPVRLASADGETNRSEARSHAVRAIPNSTTFLPRRAGPTAVQILISYSACKDSVLTPGGQ